MMMSSERGRAGARRPPLDHVGRALPTRTLTAASSLALFGRVGTLLHDVVAIFESLILHYDRVLSISDCRSLYYRI